MSRDEVPMTNQTGVRLRMSAEDVDEVYRAVRPPCSRPRP